MCCKHRASSNSKVEGGISTIIDRLFGAFLSLYTIGFIFFRIGELVPLFSYYSLECKSALIGTIILRRSPLVSRRAKYLLHVLTLVALVYIVDNLVPKSLPIANASHSSKTVVITGANSGVGYETARQLAVNYGANVIMGCRSETKCKTAANTINAEIASSSKSNGSVTPLVIDLSNLDSVKSFSLQLEGHAVDVLFNNAGYVPKKGIPVNAYGLDPAFSSMHLAHFYLTELMLKENPSMRVVNTSSGTHHLCVMLFNLPSFILKLFPPVQNPGCIDEEYLTNGIRSETDEAAYIQSKMANVMHVVEIPRRHQQSKSIAIDLGWVGTTIQPFMETQLTPTSVGWMRSTRVGVIPIIHAILSEDDDLLHGLTEGRKLEDSGIIINAFGQSEEAFSYPWWRDTGANGNLGKEHMIEMAEKLWQESTKLLQINGY